jgi:hypothetical protein
MATDTLQICQDCANPVESATGQSDLRQRMAIRADSFSRTAGSSLRIFCVSLRTTTSSSSSHGAARPGRGGCGGCFTRVT